MHLAVATGLLSIPPLAFFLTPTGRAMVATAWAWLKGVFGKIAALSPKGILVVVHKKSAQGDELDVVVSTHDGPTVAQLFQGPSATLLKRLPPALGGNCPTPPHAPANPESALPLLPPQVTAPRLLDANESQSRTTQPAVPTKKRRSRPRGGPRPRSSRRICSRCRSYRAASMRKRA